MKIAMIGNIRQLTISSFRIYLWMDGSRIYDLYDGDMHSGNMLMQICFEQIEDDEKRKQILMNMENSDNWFLIVVGAL